MSKSEFNTLEEVRDAAKAGEPVYWRNSGYRVEVDGIGRVLVVFWATHNCTVLTDDYTVSEFYIESPITALT